MKANMIRKLLVALLAVAAGAAIPVWGSNFTILNSGSTFTVSRADTSAAEIVHFRTVGLSAYSG